MAIDFSKYGTPIERTPETSVNFAKYGTPVASQDIQEEEKPDGFFKSLVKAPATIVARPLQLAAELIMPGDNTEAIDKFSKEKLGGFVAPIPRNAADVKKDVGRGVQTVAFGLPGLASAGAAFGAGASLEQGNDLFSTETAFQTALGATGSKVLGMVGQPLLNKAGMVVGKITPQVLKDVASKGSNAITEFAATHKILPEAASKIVNTGAEKLETVVNKPFEVGGKALKKTFTKTPESIIKAREQELAAIDNNYVNMRKASGFLKDEGVASRRRIASTDVLVDAVDENGLIRTQNAIKAYKAQTIDGAENVVRNNLERLGESVAPKVVEKEMLDAIRTSKIEGADLINALNGVKKEIAGLKLKANPDGSIPLTLVHDAKINTTNGINYLTPAETKATKKAIARAYKLTVEKNSKFNTEEVNKEISKYMEDIEFLKRLDGKRVKGGKLGKYFAQISGNIVGGVAGAAVGGPVGSAAGTIIGGELGGRIRGSMLQRTLGGKTGFVAPKNQILEDAIALSKTPYSNNLGNLNAKYNSTAIPSSNSIPKTLPQLRGKVNTEIGITSFRGKPVKTIAETKPYYESTRAIGFENNLKNTSKDYGVKVGEVIKVAGSWEGSIEPSFSVTLKGSMKNKISYAVNNAERANQDAVILFTKGKGDGIRYSFKDVKNPDRALKTLHKNGVSGATIYNNNIVVYDMDNTLAKKLKTFTSLTGNKPTKSYGKIQLIEKKDYAKYGGRGGDGNSVRSGKTSKVDDNIYSGEKLYHYSPNNLANNLRENGFIKGKGNPILFDNISTIKPSQLKNYSKEFKGKSLIELRADGKILDATMEKPLAQIDILMGNGPSKEFNDILRIAKKEAKLAKWDIFPESDLKRKIFQESIKRQLNEKGYIGYQSGAETIITNLEKLKTIEQLKKQLHNKPPKLK